MSLQTILTEKKMSMYRLSLRFSEQDENRYCEDRKRADSTASFPYTRERRGFDGGNELILAGTVVQ